MTIATHITAEDLMNMPEGALRHELVKGELRTMPPAGKEHGKFEGRLFAALHTFVKDHNLGEVTTGDTGYLLSRHPDTVRAPDVGFLSNQSIAKSDPKAHYWTVPPDLAIEVVSPSDLLNEVEEKIQDFLDAGTQIVWLIKPKRRTVEVFRKNQNPLILTAADNLTAPDVLAEFFLPVANIFPS